MTLQELEAHFKAAADKPYVPRAERWKALQNKRASRPDLHGFLLLDELLPSAKAMNMIAAAEHDEFWLDIDINEFAAVATPALINELTVCGVYYDRYNQSLRCNA